MIQVDGSPFIIKWDEKNGWGLFQASALGVSQELCTIVVYCYCCSEENSICFNVELERASHLKIFLNTERNITDAWSWWSRFGMWDQMVQWLKWLKRLQTLMLAELQEICVFKSSRDTLYCPADGWAPDERVQLEEKLDVCVEAEISNDFKPFQSQVCTQVLSR